MKKYFRFSMSLDQKLIIKILKLLNEEDDYSFLEIAKKLKFDLKNSKEWGKLRGHLLFMDKEGLIEERHFEDGKVDYSLENAGIKYLRNSYTQGYNL